MKPEYHDPTKPPFELTGLVPYGQCQQYVRIMPERLHLFSETLQSLATCTAGGQVRFRTDSISVSVDVRLRNNMDFAHMPRTGTCGISFYVGTGSGKRFYCVPQPEHGQTGYTYETPPLPRAMREWTLYLPLYCGIESLSVGLEAGAAVAEPAPFARPDPILFYGSSITQGGCASHPGNAYTTFVCRQLDAPQINLGFSGSARGEPEMARLIGEYRLGALVIDYDHNAPTLEHLADTHGNFFGIVRKARPDLPILLLSRPDYDRDPVENRKRAGVVRRTYLDAQAAGDKNVYFISGRALFGRGNRDACTVDGCHPNDLGFYRMAQTVYGALRRIL